MKRLAGTDRRFALRFAVALLPALLLFLPVFQYSLTTPFALIDDYWDWRFVTFFDGPQEFLSGLRDIFLSTKLEARYRPAWYLDAAVAWKLFGPTPWLHHLSRWVFHFAAVLAFAAAFLCVARGRGLQGDGDGADCGQARMSELLPPILLVYVWLFFPNVPAARLSTAELDTVFYMGLCNLAFALLLVNRHGGGIRSRRGSLWLHGLFHLGCIGLSLSKEVNVAPLLWTSIAYGALLYVNGGRSWKALLGAAPLASLLLFTLVRVYEVSSGGQMAGYGEPFSMDRIAANERTIRLELFQIETSLVAAAGLAALAAALSLAVAAGILRSVRGGARPGSDSFFVLFLLGQLVSLYAVFSISYGVATRYWYPLVPCFAALLAFGARFILLTAERASKGLARAAAAGLTGFVLFFVSVNYHDFLYQTIVQHGLRNTDERLISTITRLLDDGQTVDIVAKTAPGGNLHPISEHLTDVFSDFLHRFHDRAYDRRRLPYEDYAVLGHHVAWRLRRRDLPSDRESPAWVVAHREQSALSGEETAVISPRENYQLLSWTGALAGLLQGTPTPYLHHDAGVHPLHGGHYRWTIYRGAGLEDFASRLLQWLAEAEPVIDSEYGVYHFEGNLIYVTPLTEVEYDVARTGNVLAYTRDAACGTIDESEPRFFLHVYPVDKDDLAPGHWRHGFDTFGFGFRERGFEDAGRCTALIDLPEYGIERIKTGQYVAHGRGKAKVYEHVWSMEIVGNEPVESRPCNSPETSGQFFLRWYPTDADDLAPAASGGFNYRVFEFREYGFENDGRCISVIDFPEYDIERIETGRRRQGKTVWTGEFSPAGG